MATNNAIDRLRNILLLLNLCCVNRSFWFERRTLKNIGNVIFVTSLTITIASVFIDIFSNKNTENTTYSNESAIFIQYIVLLEVFLVAVTAIRCSKTLKTLKTLDDVCYLPPRNLRNINSKDVIVKEIRILTFFEIISIVINVVALKIIKFPLSTTTTLSVGFSAHDLEIIFCSSIINEYNKHLSKLTDEDVDANTGTRIYRHILIGSSRFHEDFNLIIAVFILVTSLIGVTFGVVVILTNDLTDLCYISFLAWRVIKYIYMLWVLCSASYKTRTHCLNLVRRLTHKLVFDFDGKEKTIDYKLTKRWLLCVKSLQPRYSDSEKSSVDLSLPLIVIDVVCNQLLVIAQETVATYIWTFLGTSFNYTYNVNIPRLD